MSVLENLKAARAIIVKPENWHKGSASNDPTGEPGTAFCAVGAVWKVNGWHSGRLDELKALTRELPPGHWSVVQFNDHNATTHADVLALFDRAIAKLEPVVKSVLPDDGEIEARMFKARSPSLVDA